MIFHVNKSPQKGAGFTLVELLLAITLMSILLGLTYTGLRAATRSSERGEKMLADGGEIRASHQFLRRQLNQMLPLAFGATGNNDNDRIVFVGDAGSIQYVAPMPGYLGSGGPQVQFIELASANDEGVLQFSHALLQGYQDEHLFERDPVILLEGVESGGFEFLGLSEDGEPTGWTTSWDQPDKLPVAVRLNVEFSDDRQMLWPELLAGVRIDESAVKGGRAGVTAYQKTIRNLISGKDKGKNK
ncbi:MAG: prepilin-type N-terminal cleavage/methylation domain-containing protein [Xanthomonadales bacterium]|nr:prepilin-type N-terminal cleavage/methylation domain-containing protein [Xanthomonadales bacterium]